MTFISFFFCPVLICSETVVCQGKKYYIFLIQNKPSKYPQFSAEVHSLRVGTKSPGGL